MFLQSTDVQLMARSLARHAAGRQAMIAQNLANADTPGYKVRDLSNFRDVYQTDAGPAMRSSRPGHFGSDRQVDVAVVAPHGVAGPNGNSVSIEREMVKSVEVRQDHDIALAIQKSLGSVIRMALGKG